MEKQKKTKSVLGKKRKRKTSITKASSEPKTIIVDSQTKDPITNINEIACSPSLKKKKKKTSETFSAPPAVPEQLEFTVIKEPEPPKNASVQKTQLPAVMFKGLSMEEIGEKYPILKNTDLIDRFLKVQLNNNQKGRIRQAIKAQLQGSDGTISADIINGKIQAILKSSENLTDSDLRRLRILYNLLKASLEPEKKAEPIKFEKKKKKKESKEKVKEPEEEIEPKKEKEPKKAREPKKEKVKVKGPKRYVVFIGNLPLDVDRDKLMNHFSDIDEHIKDIRISQQLEGKNSAIAFMEVANETTYEMALSKHHTMLDNKRINVVYTTQQKSKVSRSAAKAKAAKLIALQKSGKLVGSTAKNKKRSHRRNIMKRAKAKETAAENA